MVMLVCQNCCTCGLQWDLPVVDTLGNKTFVTISEVSGAEQCVFISTWEPVSRIRRPDYPRCFDFRVTFKTGSIVLFSCYD